MMDTYGCTFGFRVAGAPHEPRRLVTWHKAFAAHCAGELDIGEAYISAWTYGPELLAHMKTSGGVAGFSGPCFADWIPIDIDGTGADPVADALERVRRLLLHLESQGGDIHKLSCWFSGGKGFHVLMPNTIGAMARPAPGFPRVVRAFVRCIGEASGAGPDLAVYDAVRILRAPNTRHPKSGLFKMPLRAEEVLNISADAVRRLAAEPRPGDVPEPEPWCDWTLGEVWAQAESEVEATARSAPAAREDRQALNRATLDFLRNGAVNGERELRCFRAAANLAELGADERLAAALLRDVALDSGLAPGEAARAIAGGVKHGRGAAA